jgi:hypothetical protein
MHQFAAYVHDVGGDDDNPGSSIPDVAPLDNDKDSGLPTSTALMVHSTKQTWTKPCGSDLPPSDIRKVLSTEFCLYSRSSGTYYRWEEVSSGQYGMLLHCLFSPPTCY